MTKEDEEVIKLFDLNKDKINLSFSRISSFDREGPMSLVKRPVVDNEGATIGSITDDLLNDFINKTKEFDKKYYVFNGSKPTATLGNLIDDVLKLYEELPSKADVLKIIKDNGYWGSVKNPVVLNDKFDTKEFWGYLKAKYESKDKTVATSEDIQWGQDLVDTLLIHENSKGIFNNDNEKINQVDLSFVYGDFRLRGIVDILTIDHKNKTIRIIDLKTGSSKVDEFSSSFIKWRYYIQAAIYTKAAETLKEKFNLSDYKVLPFQFLYISRFEKIPFIYEVGDKWLEAAEKGFKTSSGWEYKGLEDLLGEIRWHIHNKVYDCSKALYEANGCMKINDDFITVK